MRLLCRRGTEGDCCLGVFVVLERLRWWPETGVERGCEGEYVEGKMGWPVTEVVSSEGDAAAVFVVRAGMDSRRRGSRLGSWCCWWCKACAGDAD